MPRDCARPAYCETDRIGCLIVRCTHVVRCAGCARRARARPVAGGRALRSRGGWRSAHLALYRPSLYVQHDRFVHGTVHITKTVYKKQRSAGDVWPYICASRTPFIWLLYTCYPRIAPGPCVAIGAHERDMNCAMCAIVDCTCEVGCAIDTGRSSQAVVAQSGEISLVAVSGPKAIGSHHLCGIRSCPRLFANEPAKKAAGALALGRSTRAGSTTRRGHEHLRRLQLPAAPFRDRRSGALCG